MSADLLSDDVKRFIRENIHSVEQLEVLLLLRSEAHKLWSVAEVSQRLFTVPSSAAMRLTDLNERGLVETQGEAASVCYCYSSPGTEMNKIIADLDRAYRERKTSVIELIFSRPPDHIQTFANAFRLRKD